MIVVMLQQLERKKLMALNRPAMRPTKNAKAWWKYAYKLVLGKDLAVHNKVRALLNKIQFWRCMLSLKMPFLHSFRLIP